MPRLAHWFRRIARLAAWTAAAAIGLVAVAIVAYTVAPPVSTLMLGRWLTGQPVDRQWVSLDHVSPHLVRAVIASEDQQFCAHGGVDWPVLAEETRKFLDGRRSYGASTITMQVTKNLFLWPSRSTVRKAAEIPLALAVDLVWSKRRVFEVYLNIAEWGPGVFGIEAAARRHFGKPAAALTLREASLLATALPNPILRDPRKPSRGYQRRARIIAERQADGGDWLACLGPLGRS
jgi:monofunctional biosynthetic peptidoglycan transglycosylase